MIRNLFLYLTLLGLGARSLAGPVPKEQIIAELPQKNYGQALQLRQSFEAASKEYGVPVVLLESLGWELSRWNDGDGKPGTQWTYGFMGLASCETLQNLDRAAWLAGIAPRKVKNETKPAIDAMAAFLRDVAKNLKLPQDGLESWAPALDAVLPLNDPKLRESQCRIYYEAIAEREIRGFNDGSIFAMDPATVSLDKAVSYVSAYSERVDEKPSVPSGFKAQVYGNSLVLTWDKGLEGDVLYNVYWEGGGDQQLHAVGDADYIEKNKRLTPNLIHGNRIILKHFDPARNYTFYLMAVGYNGKVSRTPALPITFDNSRSVQ